MTRLWASFDRVGLLKPLRHRDFRLLWGGTTVSLIGDGFFVIALAWQVYDLSPNPAALAAVGVAWSLPQVVLLMPGGVLADRMDRRSLMIAGDLLRALAVGAMAALSLSGIITVEVIVGLSAVFGIGDALFIPSFTSIVPLLVPEEHLVHANSLAEFINPVAHTLLGPFLGGILIGVAGVGWAFAADAASFAFSALMIGLIAHRHVKAEKQSSPMEDLREGLAFVRRNRWFWVSLVSTGAAILCTVGAWDALVTFLIKEELGASAFALGLVFAAGGVGALVAALVMGQRGRLPRKPLTAYYVAFAISCLLMLGFGLVFDVWQALVISALVQAASATSNILWFTMEYRLVPKEMLGRVGSLDFMVVLAGLPLSYALVGPLADLIGVRETLMATGALGALVMLAPIFIPGALTPERDGSLDEPPATESAPSATAV
jgi:predicted MFS family arabinose efflux permease